MDMFGRWKSAELHLMCYALGKIFFKIFSPLLNIHDGKFLEGISCLKEQSMRESLLVVEIEQLRLKTIFVFG